MESALATRDAAMKEIHHRVKNNLQIINSLLSLQSRKVRDPAAIAVLADARARINALSLIHASLYEHNNIRSVDAKSFFSQLVANLSHAFGVEDRGIHLIASIDADTIDADIAVPLALFTAEAVTGAMKSGFPESVAVDDGRIDVSYRVLPDATVLSIEDNGRGHDAGAASPHVFDGKLMTAFAKQARGVLEEGASSGGGRYVRIRIPASARATDQSLPEEAEPLFVK
jgi:two-component sensor histidine kinase